MRNMSAVWGSLQTPAARLRGQWGMGCVADYQTSLRLRRLAMGGEESGFMTRTATVPAPAAPRCLDRLLACITPADAPTSLGASPSSTEVPTACWPARTAASERAGERRRRNTPMATAAPSATPPTATAVNNANSPPNAPLLLGPVLACGL